MAKWNLNLDSLSQGGFAPSFYKSSHFTFGNKNQASDMLSMDLINPHAITAGPAFKDINIEAGVTVDAIVKGFTKQTASGTGPLIRFAIGNKIYAIDDDEVVKFGTSSRTEIDTTGTGEDGIYFQGSLYYTWYDGTDGDIGKYELSTDTLTNSFATGVHSKNLNRNIPMQIARIGFEPQFVFLNGNFIGKFDAVEDELIDDLVQAPDSDQIFVSIAGMSDRFYVAAISPGRWVPTAAGIFNPAQQLVLGGQYISNLYVWNGSSASFDSEITISGIVTAVKNINNIPFVFYIKDILLDGTIVSAIGVVDGNFVRELETYEGNSPMYYQVTDYEGFAMWTWDPDGKVYAYGAANTKEEGRLFEYSNLRTQNTVFNQIGGLSYSGGNMYMGFGNASDEFIHILDSSVVPNESTTWDSGVFNIRRRQREGIIERVLIDFEPLTTDDKVFVDFFDYTDTTTPIKTIEISDAIQGVDATVDTLTEDFPAISNLVVRLRYPNSADDSVAIRNIYIEGRTAGD